MSESDTKLRDAFASLLDASWSVREASLAELQTTDPALANELRELLHCHERTRSSQLTLLLKGGFTRWLNNEESLPADTHVGPYRIVRELARGGMGVVYVGQRDDNTITQTVAIKLTRWHAELDDLIRHEARTLLSLNHPNILRCFDVGLTTTGALYFISEWVEGDSLERLSAGGVINPVDLHRWSIELAQALCYAHARRVGHGDIKPDNILVDRSRSLRLIDFGIAVTLGPEQTTPAKGYSPGYAAPEVLSKGDFTLAADIYSFGETLKQLVAATKLEARQRADWHAVIDRCTARNPLERYGSMTAVEEDLLRIGSNQILTARSKDFWYVLSCRTRAAWIPLTVTIMLVVGLLGASINLMRKSTELQSSLTYAERANATAERTIDFVLDALTAASSEAADSESVTLAQFVDSAARDLSLLREKDAEAAARLALNFALIDHGQERYLSVIERVDQELESNLSDLLRAKLLIRRAEALRELGRLDEAEDSLEEITALPTEDHWRLNQAHARLLRTQGNPSRSEALTLQTLTSSTLNIEDRIAVLGELVVYRAEQGKLSAALAGLDEQRKLILSTPKPERLSLGRNEQNRAVILAWLDQPALAIDAVERAALIYRKRLHPEHSSHADLELIAIESERALGKWPNAIPRAKRALEIYRKQLGPSHAQVASALHIIAGLYRATGDQSTAARYYNEALVLRAADPAQVLPAAVTKIELCDLMIGQANPAKNMGTCSAAVDVLEDSYTEAHQDLVRARHVYGRALQKAGLLEAAAEQLQAAFMDTSKIFAPHDTRRLAATLDWARIQAELGDIQSAIAIRSTIEAELKRVNWDLLPSHISEPMHEAEKFLDTRLLDTRPDLQ